MYWNWGWDWAIGGITDEIPRTTGPECINYMTNRRRWTEAVLLSLLFIYIMYTSWQRLKPIKLPPQSEREKPHSTFRLFLMIAMSFVFGIEMGFKLAGRSMLFALNPCHVQTCAQIYLLAAKPSKFTTSMYRIQMNNLNGPFLAFIFAEVEGRTYPLEQTTYWIQHALLYIIPIYLLRSGAYTIEDLADYNWVKIGTAFMLFYHFTLLNALSILTGINVDHMLCAAVADPFQGPNYRIAACMHEAVLCPLLNKVTVWLFRVKHRNHTYGDISLGSSAVGIQSKNMSFETSEMYHQIQTQQQQQQQHPQDFLTPASDEILTGESMLRQRFSPYDDINSVGGDDIAEYTMPTTKID